MLEYLCHVETAREIVRALTPKQVAVLALREDGAGIKEIGELLGITRQAVERRIRAASRRVANLVPEAEALGVEERRGYRKSVGATALRPMRRCVECGRGICDVATRCQPCNNRLLAAARRAKGEAGNGSNG